MSGDERNRSYATRRAFLALGGLAFTAMLYGCDDDGNVAATGASAGKSGSRFFFVDTLGWVSADGGSLTLAFLPELLDPSQREVVVANDGIYPVLPFKDPMLEVRFDLAASDGEDPPRALRLTPAAVRSMRITYWNFDEPTPVMSFNRDHGGGWDPQGIDLVNVDGLVKKGGWAVGTLRGNMLHKNVEQRNDAYYVNVQFQTSLG